MIKKIYAGFDLGGKNLRAVVSEKDGEFMSKPICEEVDFSLGPRRISEQMIELLDKCCYSADVKSADIIAIGISSAGPLDLKKFGGSIRNSTNIKFDGVERRESYWSYQGESLVDVADGREDIYIPLVDPVRNYFARDVFLGNDVNTAVIGVVAFGEGKKYGDPDELNYVGAVTTHGAGFGAGVWCRGGVLEGVDGNAAECGHYKVVDFLDGKEERKCGCGNFGCAESFGSGTGIAKNALAKIKENIFSYGDKSGIYKKAVKECEWHHTSEELLDNPFAWNYEDYIDAKLIFDVYRSTKGQDRVAREVVEEAGKYIGRAYGTIACSYNPYFIATYGGVTRNWDILENMVLEEMRKSCNVRIPEVFVTSLGDNVGLCGAVGRAMELGR